jgi:hypothetical protein
MMIVGRNEVTTPWMLQFPVAVSVVVIDDDDDDDDAVFLWVI